MITPRLQCIIDCITKRTVCDVGTDHAYIPIALVERGLCDRVIASDIRPGPLNSARENVKKHGLSEHIELRLGGGLLPYDEGECEECIIAGMGGATIINILEEKPLNLCYILQPMNCQYELRAYLVSHGFKIVKEELEVEGFKVYNVLCVCRGESKPYSEFDLHLPKELYTHKHFSSLLNKKKREFTKIYEGLVKSKDNSEADIKKYEALLSGLKDIEDKLK